MKELTAKAIEAWLKAEGHAWSDKKQAVIFKRRLYAGNNLALEMGVTGKASWLFSYTSPVTGRRREVGFGSLKDVSLKDARARATDWRSVLAEGKDPVIEREEQTRRDRLDRQKDVTFAQVAADTLDVARARWTSRDAVGRWDKAIEQCADIANLPIRDLTASDVASVLKSIDAPTARRFVQLTMRRVFDTAIAKGLCQANPADARIAGKLVALTHRSTHQGALHWRDVPAYLTQMHEKDTQAARCIEFVTRTGCRRREATEARFDEIDFEAKVWTISARRTKQRREHSVPLPEAAFKLILLQKLRHPESEYVFPGAVGGRRNQRGHKQHAPHLSHGALQHLMPEGATVHGFRSALRSFLGDCTSVSFETAEGVLGHLVGDATVRAYRRTTDLERRREALELWNAHLDGLHKSDQQTSNVVSLQQDRTSQ